MFKWLKGLYVPPITYVAVYWSPSNGDDDEAFDQVQGPSFSSSEAARVWHRLANRDDSWTYGSLLGILGSDGNWVDI